ncbi:unnamed protein product [Paramecium sonneborni]|uniref:F-box domain-containing protein n=1 Tax=Paramecium sonneborni TaxID=65129 RepID=A0A8S1PKA5_9CILI|nr:unnamed protein product [Paramecium sonneborni]
MEMVENTPNDKFINRPFLGKICNKFQQYSLKEYEDVSNIEILHKIIQEQYAKRKFEQKQKLSQSLNIFSDWNDKLIIFLIVLIKAFTQEKTLESLNNQNEFQDSIKISPIQVLKKQLNQIKKKEFQNDDHILCFEIYKIMLFPHLIFKQFQRYDIESQSVYFQLQKNLQIEIRSNEQEQINSLNINSIMKWIPSSFFKINILPFLGILEIFKLRAVCRQFKIIVEQYWYIPFKREMIEQELTRELAFSIEYIKNFQIAAQALQNKLRFCIENIMDIIDWQILEEQIQSDQIQLFVNRPLIMMLRLLDKQQEMSFPYQIDGQFCIRELSKNIKQQILDYLNLELLLILTLQSILKQV